MKKLFLILLTVAFVVPLVFGVGSQIAEAATLKIGMIYGLSGPGAQDGMMWRDCALLCRDWINEKGGITVKGEKYKIEIIVEDSKNTLPGVIAAATKLVFQDKVHFIIGGFIPPHNDAIGSFAEKNKVIYVAAQTIAVYPDKPYYFVSGNSLIAPQRVTYNTLIELYPNVKTVGYMVQDDPGAVTMSEAGQKAAQEIGLKVQPFHIHPWEKPDYYPEWTKILAEKPDAVDIGLQMVATGGACIKQGRELGFKGPIFTACTTNCELVLGVIGKQKEIATDALLIGFNPYGKEAPPMLKEIIQRWQKTHTERFWENTTVSWDNLWTLTQAIEKAQSLDATDVMKTWGSMDTLQSARGQAKMGGAKTFGINNMVFTPCAITRLKDAELTFVKWFTPWMP